MRKVWAVVRREFLERVRTKQFVIGTILGPLLLGGLVMLPILLQRPSRARRIVVVDAAQSQFGLRVEETLRAATRGEGDDKEARYLVERVEAQGRVQEVRDSLLALTGRRDLGEASVDGVLLVTEDAFRRDTLEYLGANAGSLSDMGTLSRTLRQAVMLEKLTRDGVDPAALTRVLTPFELRTIRVADGKETGQSGEASFALAYGMSLLLYMALLLYGVQVMTSTVEEKTSRINEILVSSLRPFELLLGKIVGVGSVGLLQLGIWAGAAWFLAENRVAIAQRFGSTAEAASQIPIPEIPGGLVLVFLVFFVLGFFFYSSAYAAVGSTCNTVQETQQASLPVTLLVVSGLMVMFALLDEPSGRLAQIMTLIPPFTPFVVPVRHSLQPLSWAEIGLAAGVMLIGVLAMTWLAGKIYRVGILMYGKRASLREIFRWVRHG